MRPSLLIALGCVGLWCGAHARLATAQTADELVEQAAAAGEQGDHAQAIRLATQALERDSRAAQAYYVRGRERFRSGAAEEAVADFDHYIELRPDAAPRQWERGIACYYAGKFAEGARQFESYQQFDGQDVENSVWRYLCLVPLEGVERARATMLPIENDPRVPMMQIFELYRGHIKPADVLAVVTNGDPAADVRAAREFYAHLYLALWYESQNEPTEAARYLDLAAVPRLRELRGVNRYMWDVARIHQQKLRKRVSSPPHAK